MNIDAGGDLNNRFANMAVSLDVQADRLERQAQATERQKDLDLSSVIGPDSHAGSTRETITRTYDRQAAEIRDEASRYRQRAESARRGHWLMTGEPNHDAKAIGEGHALYVDAGAAGRVVTQAGGVVAWKAPTPAAAGDAPTTATPEL